MSDKTKKLDDKHVDGGRRALFRSLFGPVSAAMGRPLPEASAGGRRKVLRADANAEAAAMLGPLARGEKAPGGYGLEHMALTEDKVYFVFARFEGARRERPTTMAITLTSLESTELRARWKTASFRVCSTGNAPEEDIAAVAERVAREVAKVDRGQLWVDAESVGGDGAGGGESG